ncbi:MAG: hypothetical protein IKJ01_06350 [Lachnospiraceae bacterium]|nr:hypothetical protein [Lachnospiraceae bacterium]
MSILLSNEIMSAVTDELRIATKSVQIITAYCKENAIRQLSSHISTQVDEKRIMLRFRLDDIVKGSTDFSVLEYCRSQGWKVYIRFDLHAKTYIVDGKRGFIGSANATNSGLNIGSYGNMEMGILIDIDKIDLEKIEALYNDAIYVDDKIYSKLKYQYQKIDISEAKKQYSWDNSIKELFKPKITTLFSHELPNKSSFEIGDYIPFLDIVYREDKTIFKNAFRWSNAYLWLMNILKENEGCMYFGAITKKLHNALISDPKPYRTDVKELLVNLLNIIQMLHMDEIVIDKPNYTQRIRLKEVC